MEPTKYCYDVKWITIACDFDSFDNSSRSCSISEYNIDKFLWMVRTLQLKDGHGLYKNDYIAFFGSLITHPFP